MANRSTSGSTKQFVAGMVIQLAILATLAVFRSDKLVGFTYDLPPGAVSDQLVAVAEDWNEIMMDIGVADIAPGLESEIETMRGDLGG